MAINGLATGNILILKLKPQNTHFKKEEHLNSSSLRGEIELRIEAAGQNGADVSLVRMGLYGPGYEGVGQVSLRGLQGAGKIEGESLQLDFSAGVTYEALEAQRYRPETAISMEGFWRETFNGRFKARLQEAPASDQWPFFIDGFSLERQDGPQNGCLNLIDSVQIPSFIESAGEARRYDLELLPCERCLRGIRRRIQIQAVAFQTSTLAPTGQGWSDHLQAAREIWARCGIDIVAATASPRILTVTEAVRNGDTHDDVFRSLRNVPGTMNIYFIAGGSNGPGVAKSEGTSFAKSIISDQARSNINVLAHEIGHILDGADAGLARPTATTTWVGERCTVMMPITSIPNRNTCHNCSEAKHDSWQSLEAICRNPDASTMNC